MRLHIYPPPVACCRFQLTHLLRGATRRAFRVKNIGAISTHAPLARCDSAYICGMVAGEISTHAPLARCDSTPPGIALFRKISTHAPLARCDKFLLRRFPHLGVFQLTHLLRGATKAASVAARSVEFQLTHLLRGATPYAGTILRPSADFNSRTSCEVRPARPIRPYSPRRNFNSRTSCEVRRSRNVSRPFGVTFQLTHLLRGATQQIPGYFANRFISTHAPLARCDTSKPKPQKRRPISTHAPLARCDCSCHRCAPRNRFQLTHLLRGATNQVRGHTSSIPISTHAPLARCDNWCDAELHLHVDFNSRTSCEVRPKAQNQGGAGYAISTHAPLARCDTSWSVSSWTGRKFQLTHLLRGATDSTHICVIRT